MNLYLLAQAYIHHVIVLYHNTLRSGVVVSVFCMRVIGLDTISFQYVLKSSEKLEFIATAHC